MKPIYEVVFVLLRCPNLFVIRQEIMLAAALHEPATTYEDRTGFDLRRIVEDQVGLFELKPYN